MAFAAAVASPSVAAEPPTVEGDPFEILSVALELGSTCKDVRGFEYLYLSEAWGIALETSAAQTAYTAARRTALDRGADALNAALAGEQELNRHAEAYRQKAAELGCSNGINYADVGRLEAYKQLGGLMALIIGNRGQPNTASPLPPLTAEEGGLVRAFQGAVTEMFGANVPQFEAMLPETVQQRMARYPSDPNLGLARFLEDQSSAFAVLYHEVSVGRAGWTARGVTVREGSTFGYHSVRVSKDGNPELSLIVRPKAVTVNSNAWGKPVTGYIVVGRRADGAVIAGLVGESIAGAPAEIIVKAQSQGTALRSVTGTRTMEGCPYVRCFAFTAEQIAGLVPGASPEPVYFYVAAGPGATADGTGTDGQRILADRLRAFLRTP
ncbi:MAG: hypothetical protein BGO57_08890 [Sphingomonadales bacterium 63-6]|nr:MAG: hypothetical protein BGO57_08890 [Sphingomonadales bacterium 63-6]